MPVPTLVRYPQVAVCSFVALVSFASLAQAQQPTATFTAGSTYIGPPATVTGPVYSTPELAVQGAPTPTRRPSLPGPPPPSWSGTLSNAQAFPSPVPPSDAFAAQAASDFIVQRDTALTGTPAGTVSNVASPSVGGAGQAIFETYNSYAAI